jgi:hypothetical protein
VVTIVWLYPGKSLVHEASGLVVVNAIAGATVIVNGVLSNVPAVFAELLARTINPVKVPAVVGLAAAKAPAPLSEKPPGNALPTEVYVGAGHPFATKLLPA